MGREVSKEREGEGRMVSSRGCELRRGEMERRYPLRMRMRRREEGRVGVQSKGGGGRERVLAWVRYNC